MNRAVFYACVREKLFAGRLSQSQVDGMEAILDEWQRRLWGDARWLAYMLATAYHEVDRSMQPISEYGKGRGRQYGLPDRITGQSYYGRGLVQLTWKANYQKMSALVGQDLVHFPDKALELPIAVQIMFDGMYAGLFTGVGLKDYFNDREDDPVGARRIINGTDKALQIATYHDQFLSALAAAQEAVYERNS
jgi:putative chitinase